MDLNVRAFRVVQAATSESKTLPSVSAKKAASRKGGLVGGRSRADSLTAQRRQEIAKNASKARWAKNSGDEHKAE